MRPFEYVRATTPEAAIGALNEAIGRAERTAGDRSRPRLLAGGTNLVDLMKEDVLRPSDLVDITRLELQEIAKEPDGSIRLGALATNARTADHPLVREELPLLRSAILAGASPQIRNRATNGGNLMQRTRCVYFYDAGLPCNKRVPGSGCPAVTGLARQHAILGASEACIATHPSDLCVALAALDATVHVSGPDGKRVIAFEDFHRLPGSHPEIDNTLADGELITHLVVPPNPFRSTSTYCKVRERASYAFALVSVAAALEIAPDGRIVQVRVALGGIAHKPWRDRTAEALLVGQRPEEAVFQRFANAVLAQARSWGGPALPESTAGNAFKIPLAQRLIVRTLSMARDGIPTNTGEDAARSLESAQLPEEQA